MSEIKRDNSIKVSVIMPSLNVRAYIEDCIESVLHQTLSDIEIICVDAGSDDGTLEVLRKYAEEDERIRVLLSEQKSYGYQMNLGIDNASGEYIGIVETDDYVSLDMYECLYDAASKNDLDFVKSDFYGFRDDQKEATATYRRLLPGEDGYNKQIDPSSNYKLMLDMQTIANWSGIYKRSFLEKTGIRHNETPGAAYQDTGFFLQVFMLAERAMFLDQPYYYYRQDNPNSSTNKPEKAFAILKEFMLTADKLHNEDAAKWDTYRTYFNVRRYHSCKWMAKRLTDEIIGNFTTAFSDEIRKEYEEGFLDLSLFTKKQAKEVETLINDPDKYIDMIGKKKADSIKVSVIIPSLNSVDYYEQCIRSVCDQTLKDIEIICVDAGSTDGTRDIISSYAKKDSRIIIKDSSVKSYGHQINLGIDVSKGEYIGIVESDDFIKKEMFETLYEQTEGNTVDIVKGNFWHYYDIQGKEPYLVEDTGKENLAVKDCFDALEQPYILLGHPSIWCGLYRRGFLKDSNIRFMEEPGAGWVDNPFLFESMLKAKAIKWINSPVYYYRETNPSSSTNDLKDLSIPVKRMKDILDIVDDCGVDNEGVESALSIRALAYIKQVCRSSNFDESDRSITSAIRDVLMRIDPNYLVTEQDKVFYSYYINHDSDVDLTGKTVTMSKDDYLKLLDGYRLTFHAYDKNRSKYLREKEKRKILQEKYDKIVRSSSYKVARKAGKVPRMLKNVFKGDNE